ncbi:MAG TPA: hypothetical protein VGR92_04310 [Steroidobacteraceae bacterium]|nr:hypothetical protein [Steroidobacteraceae bacterium]
MSDTAEPWHQLWATFSVKDHCQPGAFVAEVLLYDKLLIPVVPTEEDGLSAQEADAEWDRWLAAGWDPERQAEVTSILGDSAELIPWTSALQGEWRARMEGGFAAARRNGYFESGTVLQRFAPAMARAVVAVSQYRSLKDLERAGIRRRTPETALPASSLLAVLGHELLLPDDPEQDEFDVLGRAVAESQKDEYRNRRRALFEWQQKFLGSGALTDATSIRTALKEMTNLVDRLKTATAAQKKWQFAKRFFSFLSIVGKGMALGGPPLTIVGGGTGVVASVGTFVVDQLSPSGMAEDAAIPAATLVLGAEESLGVDQ